MITFTRQTKTNLTTASFSLSESTCASSDGGPGLNFGEHIAGRSMLGTIQSPTEIRQDSQSTSCKDIPMNPRSGVFSSGSAISALMPHTMVVLPIRTSAEPSAVDMDPRRVSRDAVVECR